MLQLAQKICRKIFFVYWPIRNKNVYISHVFCSIKMNWEVVAEDLLKFIRVKFGSNWHSSFREDLFCELANQKQEWMYRLCFFQIKTKWGIFVQDLLNIIPAKFGSNWPCSSKEKIETWKVYRRQVMAKAHMNLQVKWGKNTFCLCDLLSVISISLYVSSVS